MHHIIYLINTYMKKTYHPYPISIRTFLIDDLRSLMSTSLLHLIILLPLLLLVWDPSCLCLALLHLTQVETNGSGTKGVGVWRATMLLIGGSKAADECIQAAPSLPERAGTGCGRGRLAKEEATVRVDLSLPKLVKVAKEIKNMVEVALREWNLGSPILQVLPKGVPISSFL